MAEMSLRTFINSHHLLWAAISVFYAFIILDGTKEELGLDQATSWHFEYQEWRVWKIIGLESVEHIKI